jgi:hypothetical protein
MVQLGARLWSSVGPIHSGRAAATPRAAARAHAVTTGTTLCELFLQLPILTSTATLLTASSDILAASLLLPAAAAAAASSCCCCCCCCCLRSLACFAVALRCGFAARVVNWLRSPRALRIAACVAACCAPSLAIMQRVPQPAASARLSIKASEPHAKRDARHEKRRAPRGTWIGLRSLSQGSRRERESARSPNVEVKGGVRRGSVVSAVRSVCYRGLTGLLPEGVCGAICSRGSLRRHLLALAVSSTAKVACAVQRASRSGPARVKNGRAFTFARGRGRSGHNPAGCTHEQRWQRCELQTRIARAHSATGKQQAARRMGVAPVSKVAVLVKIGSWKKSSHKVVPVVTA